MPTRNTLIIPMNIDPGHAFGRLSGDTNAYWLYAERMKKEGKGALVYYSHEKYLGGTNLKECSDGYIWHNGGLCWHFEIDSEGTLENQLLTDLEKTKWAQYIPPFRRYDDHKYWFLLKNLRKLKEKIVGESENHGKVLNIKNFWRENGGAPKKKLHSSMFRQSSGAPWIVKTSVALPLEEDTENLTNPLNDLVHDAIVKRYGIDEQAIEEIFLLKILWYGFDNKLINKIWQQDGFTDEEDRRKYRFDAAFRVKDGPLYAVEFKKGSGKDAPFQLKQYIDKSPRLKEEGISPIPLIVCARETKELYDEMQKSFPNDKWRILKFKPEISFADALTQQTLIPI